MLQSIRPSPLFCIHYLTNLNSLLLPCCLFPSFPSRPALRITKKQTRRAFSCGCFSDEFRFLHLTLQSSVVPNKLGPHDSAYAQKMGRYFSLGDGVLHQDPLGSSLLHSLLCTWVRVFFLSYILVISLSSNKVTNCSSLSCLASTSSTCS